MLADSTGLPLGFCLVLGLIHANEAARRQYDLVIPIPLGSSVTAVGDEDFGHIENGMAGDWRYYTTSNEVQNPPKDT